MFARQKINRIPIVDRNNVLVSLITKGMILRWMHSNINSMGSITSKKVSDFSNVYKEVYTINENKNAIEAFDLMVKKKIGGINFLINSEVFVLLVIMEKL